MENLGRNDTGGQNVNEPVSFDDKSVVSRSPLNLGGGGTPLTSQTPKVGPMKPVAKSPNPAPQTVPFERITGVKTFFTKLHAGAIDFLGEQITKWLKENPDVKIKLTNTVTGEIQGKKTEPNIIITVWY